MGGNVFRHTHTVRRLVKEEYYQYANGILGLIREATGPIKLHVTQAIESKEDFGDMDIIICGRDKRNLIENLLTIKEYPMQKNGDVTSFLFIDFQVDLIFTDESHYEYSCNYFDWNDLGNLIGRMSKQLGFKHGHDGLYYVLRNDDRIIKEFLLSTSYLDILHILGLDKIKFWKGFATYEELFEYVIRSPFFNPDSFKLENLNNINRVRDRKRKTYNLFLKYIQEKDIQSKGIRKLTYEEKEEFVLNKFPHIRHQVQELKDKAALGSKIKERINGRIIMNLFSNIDGLTVGKYIEVLKERRPDLYSEAILNMTEEEVHLAILTTISDYKKELRDQKNVQSNE